MCRKKRLWFVLMIKCPKISVSCPSFRACLCQTARWRKVYPWTVTEDQETGYLQLPRATCHCWPWRSFPHYNQPLCQGLHPCEHIHLQTQKSVGNCLLIAPTAVKTRNFVLTDLSGRFCWQHLSSKSALTLMVNIQVAPCGFAAGIGSNPWLHPSALHWWCYLPVTGKKTWFVYYISSVRWAKRRGSVVV